MYKIKTNRLKTIRIPTTLRSRSTKRSTSKSPKQSNTIVFKFQINSSQDRPAQSDNSRSKNSLQFPTHKIMTPRTPAKLRICTPSKPLNFLQKLISESETSPNKQKSEYSLGQFLKEFKNELTEDELGEIFNYKTIYFWGNFEEKAIRKKIHKHFDDDKGNLLLFKGDHVAYRYEIVKMLGQGSFGQVCECIDHKDMRKVAVKIIKSSKNFVNQAKIEIKILKLISENDANCESNIIHMKDSFTFRNHICIVTELLGQNLYEMHKEKGFCSFPMSTLKKFAFQLLTSLKFLSNLKVIHCDLKPENILIDKSDKNMIKLVDFGASCLSSEKLFTYIQSRYYRAPEIILGLSYGCSIDMWSFGCILAELANGKPLFPANCERELLQLIMQVKGQVPQDMLALSMKKHKFFDKGEIVLEKQGKVYKPLTSRLCDIIEGDALFVDFIEKCLEWDPNKRITPEQALKHPWVVSNERMLVDSSRLFRILNKRMYAGKKKEVK